MIDPDMKYGSDKTGRLWRAHPKWDQPALTVLEVLYVDETDKPSDWDFWAIMDDQEMNDISYQNEIIWAKDVIEA